jgi:hypothetical protein
MHANEKPYDTLTRADLQALSEFAAGEQQVFSLYLTLEHDQPPLDRFDMLLAAAAQDKKLSQTEGNYQQQWSRETERMRAWLNENAPRNLNLPLSQQYGHPLREERSVTDNPPTRADMHTLDYLAERGELPETDNIDARGEPPLQGEGAALGKRAAQDDLLARARAADDDGPEGQWRAGELAQHEETVAPNELAVAPQNWPAGRRGLALFSGPGLWRAYLLPAPVPDQLLVSGRPFVRPLELLQNEYPCTLAVMVDPGLARLVRVFMGQASELEDLHLMPVTGMDMDSSIEAYSREAVAHAQQAWQMYPCDYLILAGSRAARTAVRAALPDELRERLVGEADLSPMVTLEAVRDRVVALDEKREQDMEAQHVQEFVTSLQAKGAAVAGLEQVLLAVRSKRVRLLLVEADFHQAGGVCPNCGYLGEGQEGLCLICEMAMRPEPDMVGAALKQVLDAGGEVDVLRSPLTRGALTAYGRIGALLYDSGQPPMRDRSNQRTLSNGGHSHPDALHDEAIDESFPASDPPSWSQ